MNLRAVEGYPALVTEAVLDAYARYLLSRAAPLRDIRPANEEEANEESSAATAETPQSLEEALAPLELLYGKTALSAIGIVLHGAEPVIRYVEEIDDALEEEGNTAGQSHGSASRKPAMVVTATDDSDEVTSDDEGSDAHGASRDGSATDLSCAHDPTPSSPPSRKEGDLNCCVSTMVPSTTAATIAVTPSQQARQRGRCLYHVGEHTLFSPYYCPCSAYAYQSIQRQEVWCCKHLLALQLALRMEAAGLPHNDTLRVRVVPAAEFTQLLLRAL